MPFKRQVGVDELVSDAQKDGRFIAEDDVATSLQRQSRLRPGYLYVTRVTPTDWDHVGFVLQINQHTFDTLEGNTGGEAGTKGSVARQHSRGYAAHDFIRLI